MYTYEEAQTATLKYYNGDELATDVYLNKYALKSTKGFLESTPHDMHDRLAAQFAAIDERYGLNYAHSYKEFRAAFNTFSHLVAQGSPMAAVGNHTQILSASNCVVVEQPADSIDGIMKTAGELAQLYKRRCGVGADISTLRPNGAAVNNAARKTTGPCSFADLYSYITRLIGQDGRRGALMITMSVHHPDVEEFAAMKSDLKKVTGANVSVQLTDEFMNAVANDEFYEQRWPCKGKPQIRKSVRAKKVWDTIIKYATETADPGLQFWDNATRTLPAHCYPEFKTITSNPCSEIFLSAYDSCRLLSINLTGYVRNAFAANAYFDLQAFEKDVRLAMRALDNLVDIEIDLIERIKNSTDSEREKEIWDKLKKSGHRGRRTGLGTHGLADTLAQLCIKYDSEQSLSMCDEIYRMLRDTAYDESVNLAEARGPFPAFNWELEKDNEFINLLPTSLLQRMKRVGRRNISILCNAPTGTVSLLSKCGEFNSYNLSSGIEPVFRLSYTRRKKINPNDKESRVDYVDKLGDKWQEYKVYHGNLRNFIEKYPNKEIPDYFVTSDNIDWEFRVRLQGVIGQYIDHSISSTINLPRGTKRETVGKIYTDAWKYGLKGITVYVDGSKDGVLITDSPNGRPKALNRIEAPGRPKTLPCDIHSTTIKGQKWIVLVGLLEDEPYEVFGGLYQDIAPCTDTTGFVTKKARGKYNLTSHNGKSTHEDIVGKFQNPEYSWATRLVSTALRHGTPVEFMVEQLSKDGKIHDFNKAMARVLKRYIKNGRVKSAAKCFECQSSDLIWEEGCHKCASCGYAKCG